MKILRNIIGIVILLFVGFWFFVVNPYTKKMEHLSCLNKDILSKSFSMEISNGVGFEVSTGVKDFSGNDMKVKIPIFGRKDKEKDSLELLHLKQEYFKYAYENGLSLDDVLLYECKY